MVDASLTIERHNKKTCEEDVMQVTAGTFQKQVNELLEKGTNNDGIEDKM